MASFERRLGDLEDALGANGRECDPELEALIAARGWRTLDDSPSGRYFVEREKINDWIASGYWRVMYRQALADGWDESPDPEELRVFMACKAAVVYFARKFGVPDGFDLGDLDRLQVAHMLRQAPDEVLEDLAAGRGA